MLHDKAQGQSSANNMTLTKLLTSRALNLISIKCEYLGQLDNMQVRGTVMYAKPLLMCMACIRQSKYSPNYYCFKRF